MASDFSSRSAKQKKGTGNQPILRHTFRPNFMQMIRISRILPLFQFLAVVALPSCQLMSEPGPPRSAIEKGSANYELVPVTSMASFSTKRPNYGRAEIPDNDGLRVYSDKIRPRDQLNFLMSDVSDKSPFHNAGLPRTGPIEVPSDGRVSVPYVGEIKVLDRSLADVADELEKMAKPVSNTVQVSVSRSGRLEKTASIVGEVKNPGPMRLDREGITSTDLFAFSGGANGSEHLYSYTLRRGGRDFHFDYVGFKSSSFPVQDGDLVTVSKDASNRYYVMGALNRPTTVDFPVPAPTLADAVGSGIGLDENRSDASGVFVFRKGNPDQVFTFDFKKPDVVLLSQHFPILGEDIVYVTEAPLARWNRVISQILPISVSQAAASASRYGN